MTCPRRFFQFTQMRLTMRRTGVVLMVGTLLLGCEPDDPELPEIGLPACGDLSPVTVSAVDPSATVTEIASPSEIAPNDRVGFPEDYRDDFFQFYVFDRFDAQLISYVCANEVAANTGPDEDYPYGSLLLSETWRPVMDEDGALAVDDDGRLIRGELAFALLMRKEPGFGEDYGADRSGEWEYVGFLPDGSYHTRPEESASCAACHTMGAMGERDFVFRTNVHHLPDRYARTDPVEEGEIGISRMAYHPADHTVSVGETVQWENSTIDETAHTVTGLDGSFGSDPLDPGGTFSHTFTAPGRYEYACALHPEQMRGVVEVTED